MNIYTLRFGMELGSTHEVTVEARNKVEAVAAGFEKVTGWRNKDRVVSINIVEDADNFADAESYR